MSFEIPYYQMDCDTMTSSISAVLEINSWNVPLYTMVLSSCHTPTSFFLAWHKWKDYSAMRKEKRSLWINDLKNSYCIVFFLISLKFPSKYIYICIYLYLTAITLWKINVIFFSLPEIKWREWTFRHHQTRIY